MCVSVCPTKQDMSILEKEFFLEDSLYVRFRRCFDLIKPFQPDMSNFFNLTARFVCIRKRNTVEVSSSA